MNSSLSPRMLRAVVSCFLLSVISTYSLATTYVVTSNADAGVGTFREALDLANANPDKDTITFNIAGGGSVQTINIDLYLEIKNDVFVDGYSQFPTSSTPPVVLTNSIGEGIIINGGTAGSKITGLVINDMSGPAMIINTSNNIIQGCFFGVDASGSIRVSNQANGISINLGANNNLIGGTGVKERNVISGSNANGIDIKGDNNILINNLIGTNLTGVLSLGNNQNGILINGISSINNQVGGINDSMNVISGNGNNGIRILNSSNNRVKGNLIGTDITGTNELGNSNMGIRLENSNLNIIGGLKEEGNVISSNKEFGLHLEQSNNNQIKGNIIGLGLDGTTILGNRIHGIYVVNSINNLIGGVIQEGNIISSNSVIGINLNSAPGTIIKGNYIGISKNAVDKRGNFHGIQLDNSPKVIIGGNRESEGNIISNSTVHGINLNGGSDSCIIKGNRIGTGVLGTEQFGNNVIGAVIKSNATIIGDTSNNEGNIIVGSGLDGLLIANSNNNIVKGNYIGVNHLGDSIPNKTSGINISVENAGFTAENNIIEYNTLAYNNNFGISIGDALDPFPGSGLENNNETGNTVRFNSIYCNPLGGIYLQLSESDDWGNNGKTAPAIDATLSNSHKIVGITDPLLANDTIDIYLMDNECATCEVNPQGKTYVASIVAGTDGSWEYDYGSTIPGKLVATATDADGNTSEFSKCYNPCYLQASITPIEINKIQLTQGVTGSVNLSSVNSNSISGIDSLKYFVSSSKGMNWYEYADKDTSITFSYPGTFETGDYEISLVIYSGGCRDTSSISFNVDYFFIPNLLTPNNDRYNDKFFISDSPDRFNLTIYNRYGAQIYKKEGYRDDWDLTEVKDGMYFYHIIDRKEDNKSYKGWIHVLSNQL